ncbi:MAG TPA: hypothetical protein VGC79_32685 [Polyangiaceae bacterium]
MTPRPVGTARRTLFAFGLLASLAGCKSTSERSLVDTERRHFYAKCQRSGECVLRQTSGEKRSGGKSALSLLRVGRLVGICDVVPGQGPETPAECRALVCQSDADCPPAHGLKDGQCLNALCADPAQALVPEDSVLLCLAGSGLGNEQARQIERYALGLNCGTPCKVPAPCRQP